MGPVVAVSSAPLATPKPAQVVLWACSDVLRANVYQPLGYAIIKKTVKTQRMNFNLVVSYAIILNLIIYLKIYK